MMAERLFHRWTEVPEHLHQRRPRISAVLAVVANHREQSERLAPMEPQGVALVWHSQRSSQRNPPTAFLLLSPLGETPRRCPAEQTHRSKRKMDRQLEHRCWNRSTPQERHRPDRTRQRLKTEMRRPETRPPWRPAKSRLGPEARPCSEAALPWPLAAGPTSSQPAARQRKGWRAKKPTSRGAGRPDVFLPANRRVPGEPQAAEPPPSDPPPPPREKGPTIGSPRRPALPSRCRRQDEMPAPG